MAPGRKLFLKRNCVSCRIAWLYLNQNKIPFTMVDVDERKPSEFENVSPLGSVPLFQDGDLNIYGSQAIIFYLAEKYTNYAGFGKSNERLLIESVINWAATTLLRDVGSNYVYPSLSQPEDALGKEGNASLVEFGKAEVFFHLDTLEKHYLSQRDFLCCTVPTLADSWIAMVLSLLELVCLDLAPWPKVKSWMNSMKASSDYVDVSYNHEEMVQKCLYGLNDSTSDLKTVDTDPVT